MGDSNPKQKKIVVAGLASILLIAAVVGVVVSNKKGESNENGGSSGGNDIAASTKAVQEICGPTDFKETCQKSLAKANTTDPKELVALAFDAAVQNIGRVLKNSTVLKEAAADPSTKGAYDVCQEVLETSVEDLKRSVDALGELDIARVEEYVEDLRTWLSAVITNQETCIDAFENTTGESGEKMKKLLRTSRELTSNGLAMVSEISSVLDSLQLGGRKLLSSSTPAFAQRRLLAVSRMSMKPTMVVAKDGSGQFKTIGDAIATIKKKNEKLVVIFIKAGVYDEHVVIPKTVNNVMLVGEGPLKTKITGKKSFAGGVKTFHTATVAVNGHDFFAKDIGIENTAGAVGHQAVALRVSGDRAVFFNVAIDGYQDTLYAHRYRQFYRDCSISGTIDFVFGDSLAIFQNCKFIVRKPSLNQACMVTAQGRVDRRSDGAFVIQNGHFLAEPALLATKPPVKVYLGRPWKPLSRTIIMQSEIGAFVDPTGWAPWAGTFAIDTCYYGEYQNRGPGSNTKNRVTWKGIKKITPQIAESWTGGKAYQDSWIRQAGVPYVPTMMKV